MPSEKIVLAQQLAAQGWPTHKIVQETNLSISTVEDIKRGTYKPRRSGKMELVYSTSELEKRLDYYQSMVDRIHEELVRRHKAAHGH